MTALDVLTKATSQGVALSARDGRLHYKGEPEVVELLLPLLREHRDAIIAELQTCIPWHVRLFLLLGGYELSAWTPAACRGLLDRLEAEWEEFNVHGWHGLAMPDSWPWETQSAVLSIYVKSMQEVTPWQ